MPDDDSASEVVFPHADSSPRASHVAAWQSLAWDALVESAHSLARAGRRADARAAYELALARLPEAGDSAVASSLARWVARTWQVDADHDVALDCIEAAEAIALAFRDQVAYGHALNVRAIVSWQRGELDEAQRLYSQCLDIALRESDAHLAATASQNLGIIANVRGDLDQALHHYCASLVHSVAGRLPPGAGLILDPPFRAPHHTISDAGLVGGGRGPLPGEVSLAHRGVLFLDELPEFHRNAIEALRQPLEEGYVSIARAGGATVFPAAFALVAAMNPCPCGFRGDPRRVCRCAPDSAAR